MTTALIAPVIVLAALVAAGSLLALRARAARRAAAQRARAAAEQTAETMATLTRGLDAAVTRARAAAKAPPHAPAPDGPAAGTDPLTGLGNRTAFLDALARAAGTGGGAALVLADVDDFAELNERAGTAACDRALADLARMLSEAARGEDAVCRVGGDRLAVVLAPGTLADADAVFARFRAALERTPPAGLPASVSGGLAARSAGEDALSLLTRAEEALLAAKATSRGSAVASAPG